MRNNANKGEKTLHEWSFKQALVKVLLHSWSIDKDVKVFSLFSIFSPSNSTVFGYHNFDGQKHSYSYGQVHFFWITTILALIVCCSVLNNLALLV